VPDYSWKRTPFERSQPLRRTTSWEGVFEPLRDPARFAQVQVNVELGTVVWPGGADIDPDVLYSTITGIPIAIPAAAERR
jgi:hypothetical protein